MQKKLSSGTDHGLSFDTKLRWRVEQLASLLDGLCRLLAIVDVPLIVRLSWFEFSHFKCRVLYVRIPDDAVLGQKLAVYVDLVVSKLDRLTRQTDDALYVIDLILNKTA